MSGQARRVFEEAPPMGKRAFYYDNVLWEVSERPARQSDIQGKPHLVFASDSCIRRVRNFPENWRELLPGELYDLSWQI